MASLLDLVDSNVTTLPKAAILHLEFHYKDVKPATKKFFDNGWIELHSDPRNAPAEQVCINFGSIVLSIKPNV